MKKEVICGIYKIISPTGKIYIGQALDIKRRQMVYKNHDSTIKSQKRLYRSLKKYGFETHTFEIIEECEIEELNCRERHWQDEFDVIGKNGLNCVLIECGDKRREYTEETKQLMSERMRGDKNPMWGYKHSEEQLEKMRARKGENASFFGRKHTEESLEKQRQTKKDRGILTDGCNNPNATEVIDTLTLEIFCTVNDCAVANKVSPERMSSFLTGNLKNRTSCMYLKDYKEGMVLLPVDLENHRSNKIIDLSTGILYRSLRRAVELLEIKIPYQTLVAQLCKNIPNKANLAYYVPDLHDHLIQK